MRSKQFSGGPDSSKIRGRREYEVPNQTNWDRIIYLTILGLILLFAGYKAAEYYLFLYGQGQVITSNFKVRAPNDIELVSLEVSEGDSVSQNNELFRYQLSDWQQSVDSLRQLKAKKEELEESLSQVKDKLTIKRRELEELQQQINYLKQRKQEIRKEIRLNLETRSALSEVERDLVDLRSKINITQTEREVLKQRRFKLQKQLESVGKASGSPISSGIGSSFPYRSPVSGMVTRVFKESSELAIKSERILTIRLDTTKVYIRAIFNQKAAQYFMKGDVLNVEFDNGYGSFGIVREIYAVESDFFTGSVDSDDKAEPSKRVVIELRPYDEDARKQWRRFSDIGVTISAFIFQSWFR